VAAPKLSPILTVAQAAYRRFPRDIALLMIAISGAEAGFRADAKGDPVSSFPPAEQAEYAKYAVDGYTSFGPWQINLRWNREHLGALTGSRDPRKWRDYLFVVNNSGDAAKRVYASQGPSAWSTYSGGQYSAFTERAVIAYDAADRATDAFDALRDAEARLATLSANLRTEIAAAQALLDF